MDSPPTTIENQTPKEKPVVISSEGSKKSIFKYSFVNPKILGAMTVLLLLVGGVGTGVYLTQQPQQAITQATLPPVSLNFQPSEIQTQAGSELSIDIFVQAADNQITSTDLTIKYDPQILTLKSITPKDFLPKILVPPQIASDSASISLGTEGTSGVSGNGIIAGLLFEVNPQTSQTSTGVNFDPQKTQINVLNRNTLDTNDALGTAQITITPASETVQSTQTASGSGETATVSDFNNDGLTNSIDLSLMYSAWGNPETAAQEKADLNGDGAVNGMDYAAFLPSLKR